MSARTYDAIVIGAGPAGSAAAIHLAQAGRDVLLLEKASMPRDKLCGEFLSTEVAEMCAGLGVLERMIAKGAPAIRLLEVADRHGRRTAIELPGTAMALSRRTFDHLLFQRAGEAGAATRDAAAVRYVDGGLDAGFRVGTHDAVYDARVVVGAFGRRSSLDRKLQRRSLQRRSPYVAFKAHFAGEAREGAIELYPFPFGYCGVLGDENGEVNVCWIGRSDQLKSAGGSPEKLIDTILAQNAALASRISRLERDQDFLAAGQISFRQKELFALDVCMIGDAAGMIAPLCGDGMAMALRSAELAAPLVDRFLSGALDPASLKRAYGKMWQRRFVRQMKLGRFLHAVLTRPRAADVCVALARVMPGLARSVFAATRG